MLEDYIAGERMSGQGHGEHGKKGSKRKTHEVEENQQNLYDKVMEEVFDPEFHRETTQKHNDAYISAVGNLKGKRFDDRFEAEEALTDAVIKYRTEAGLPVSKEPEHRHHIYQEVRELLELADSGKMGDQLAGKIDHLIREGNLYRLLDIIHQREKTRNIKGKIDYLLNKYVPHDKEPEFYQGLVKAHGNDVGRYFKKGDLARLGNRETIIKTLANHYDTEMERIMEDYVDAQKTHKKPTEHGHGEHAAPAHH